MSQAKRDRITLERLVKILDSPPPSHHTTLLKLQATLKQANKLLNELNDDNYPSTSRYTQPPRNSRGDLEKRIELAEKRLNVAWDDYNARTHSTPKNAALDLDFLLPSLIPPPMRLPSRSSTPPPSSPPKSPKLESKLMNSTAPIPESTISHSSLSSSSRNPSPTKDTFDLPPHPSSLSSSFGPSGMRHRVPPTAPWLRNRQLKEKEKEEKESLLPSPQPPTSEDLLPASSTTATSSDLLSHHHSLQTSLLSDLTSLSTALKTSSLTFSQNLEKDKEVMEEAERKLQGNEGRMKLEQKRLEGVRGKTRGTTCWTLGVLCVVVAMWVGVFLLIKVT